MVFTLEDPEPLLYHDEPIWRDGELVGRITSGAYGHTLGRAVGLGYVAHSDGVSDAFVSSGRWELEIACERHRARAQLTPPYDPKSLRVRARRLSPRDGYRGGTGGGSTPWRRVLRRPRLRRRIYCDRKHTGGHDNPVDPSAANAMTCAPRCSRHRRHLVTP